MLFLNGSQPNRILLVTNLDTYAKPTVAVDLAIVAVVDGQLKVLLVQLPEDNVPGLALPGGIVRVDASVEDTVTHVLTDKVGIGGVHFEQLATYGALDRDPRGRVISVVHLALCPADALHGAQGTLADLRVDCPEETGGPITAPLPLAFDHAAVLGDVVKRLRGKLDYTRIAFSLLPRTFALLGVHEAILGRRLTPPPRSGASC